MYSSYPAHRPHLQGCGGAGVGEEAVAFGLETPQAASSSKTKPDTTAAAATCMVIIKEICDSNLPLLTVADISVVQTLS